MVYRIKRFVNEDFYFFNYGTGATAVKIEAANSNTTFAGIVTTEKYFRFIQQVHQQ